jgi:5-bromo-4-chloroindolyl phosphate hydrolysis protein
MIGAGLVTAGMFVVAWLGSGARYTLFESVLYGAAALLGCYLYYDFDPARKDPEIAAVGITTEELIELLDEAEGRLERIEQSSRKIKNVEFKDRLRRIVKDARGILDTIESDPVDARRARKFLKVYLDGAQQVTEGYARTHTEGEDHALEDNFRRVLTTIETVIAEQQTKLKENNLSDLDVNIEVLQMQLEKEGVT